MSRNGAFGRRAYLALAGSSLVGLAGCGAGAPDSRQTAAPTDARAETSTRDAGAAGTDPTTAGPFPVPPDAAESDLRFVTRRRLPDGGRNDRLTDLQFFVDAPDGVDLQGYEVESAEQTLAGYEDVGPGWTLDRDESPRASGWFAKDEMVPERSGGGFRGRPNRARWYRAGDRGAFVWVFRSGRRGPAGTQSMVLATGPWEGVDAVVVDYPKRPLDRGNLPRFLTHNVCDLQYVDRVSRFRSSYGHSHTADIESCRTNKHYMEGFGVNDVPRYSPVSGTIHQVMQDGEVDVQTFIVPDDHPAFVVRQEHVLLDDGIDVGTHVEAGDRLGVWNEAEGAGSSEHATAGEVLVHMRTPEGTVLVSYFDVLTDDAFAEWADAGGPATREAYIIPKAVRDASPNTCGDDESYEQTATVDGGDWVEL